MPPRSPLLTAPNIVTAARATIVLALAALIGAGESSTSVAWGAVCAASIAAALDGVDGWLARRTATATAFGARFDMETDALLILVLSVLVWRWGKAGWWVLLSGAMRYAFVAGGLVLPWMRGTLTPTLRGKTVAVVQMVALIVAIGPNIPVPMSTAIAAAALALLTWSFAVDVRRLWHGRHDGTFRAS